MIFSDKQTAKEVRTEVGAQLHEFILDICENVQMFGKDADVEIISDYILDKLSHELPPLVGTMLYKSGIIHRNIHSEDETPHYPVSLFYDNDDENDFKVTQAMNSAPNRLIGGLYKGRINT
jgi:hypothetical protein